MLGVADDQGGLLEPRHDPRRREVGHQVEVMEALLPTGERKAVQRLHVEVDAEEVERRAQLARTAVSTQERVVESAGGQALAHQPSPQVGQHAKHGVDPLLPGMGADNLGIELA